MSRHDTKPPRLEHYSQQFAKRLFARHPEWKQYAGHYAEGEPDALDYFLEVSVPSGNPQVAEPLVIRTRPTNPKEVFVKWGGSWHTHIIPWPKQSMEEHYENALDAIDLLVSDDYLFANVYRGERCIGGWGRVIGGAETAKHMQPTPGQRTVVRSWRGTHDQEF